MNKVKKKYNIQNYFLSTMGIIAKIIIKQTGGLKITFFFSFLCYCARQRVDELPGPWTPLQ